jgi:hypothetical protein
MINSFRVLGIVWANFDECFNGFKSGFLDW